METYEHILKELNHVFHDVFKNKAIIVTPNTTAGDVQEWTSLNHMHLIAAIESHFNCEFSFDEVVNFQNVNDVILSLQSKMA